MAVQRITKRTVDSTLPQPGRDVFVWDSDLPGFGLKVTPTGRRVYVAQYRAAGMGIRATTKRETLGIHGVLTTEEARDAAKRLLAGVRLGNDPASTRAGGARKP